MSPLSACSIADHSMFRGLEVEVPVRTPLRAYSKPQHLTIDIWRDR